MIDNNNIETIGFWKFVPGTTYSVGDILFDEVSGRMRVVRLGNQGNKLVTIPSTSFDDYYQFLDYYDTVISYSSEFPSAPGNALLTYGAAVSLFNSLVGQVNSDSYKTIQYIDGIITPGFYHLPKTANFGGLNNYFIENYNFTLNSEGFLRVSIVTGTTTAVQEFTVQDPTAENRVTFYAIRTINTQTLQPTDWVVYDITAATAAIEKLSQDIQLVDGYLQSVKAQVDKAGVNFVGKVEGLSGSSGNIEMQIPEHLVEKETQFLVLIRWLSGLTDQILLSRLGNENYATDRLWGYNQNTATTVKFSYTCPNITLGSIKKVYVYML
jgi:hypothetical protein